MIVIVEFTDNEPCEYTGVAQSVEQRADNALVDGSIPSVSTIEKSGSLALLHSEVSIGEYISW